MFTVDIVLNTITVTLYSADCLTTYARFLVPFSRPTMTNPAFAVWANNTLDVQGVSFQLENPATVLFSYEYPGTTVVIAP